MSRLFEFQIDEIPAALLEKFGDKATSFWNDKEEFHCGGCLHKDTYVYVIAADRDAALVDLQDEGGLCSQCICNLIADQGYEILAKG